MTPRFGPLRLMWSRHPWLTVGMVITGVASGLASIAVIDTINRAIHESAQHAHLLLEFVSLNIIAVLLRGGAGLLPGYASMKIMSSLRMTLCRTILATPLEEIERRGVANILNLLTGDIPHLAQTLLVLPVVLVQTAILASGIGYLAYLSLTVFVLTLTALTVGVSAYYLVFFREGTRFSRKVRAEYDTFNQHAHGLLFGNKELKLNGMRRRWFQRAGIDFSARRLARFEFFKQLWFIGGNNIGQVCVALLLGFVIFGVPYWQNLDIATLTASALTIMYVMGPLSALVDNLPRLGEGTIACEQLAEFGFPVSDRTQKRSRDEPLPHDRQPVLRAWQGIELRGVRTRYHDVESAASFELGPLDLRIQPEELLFVVGGNGSGKSTLAKILTGLYSPLEGQILLDGQPVGQHNQDAYRSLFATVFTDFHLFKRVHGSNRGAAVTTRAQEYLNWLGLATKVQIMKRRYTTTSALSSGQRKRLALLCTDLEDRPICVLDEWAADQDPVFKRFFYEVVLADLKRRGKCVVVITHDDQYFEHADRIVKLSEGKIISDTVLHSNRRKTAI